MPSEATTPTKPIMSPTHIDQFCTPELTVGEAVASAHSGGSARDLPGPPLSPSVVSIDVQRAESAVLRPLLPLIPRVSEWQAISVTHGGEFP